MVRVKIRWSRTENFTWQIIIPDEFTPSGMRRRRAPQFGEVERAES